MEQLKNKWVMPKCPETLDFEGYFTIGTYGDNIFQCYNEYDYITMLKELMDLQQKDVQYVFEKLPSAEHVPQFRCTGTSDGFSVTRTGHGKKKPKKEVAFILYHHQALKLQLSGDIESNPGPMSKPSQKLERLNLKLRKEITRLENKRQKQDERSKTQRSRVRKQKHDAKIDFHFQMDTISREVKSIASSLMTPTTLRTASYAAANFISPGSGTAAACVVEGNRVIKTMENITSTVEGMAQQIPETLQKYTNLSDVATLTMDTISRTFERISSNEGLLAKLENMVSTISSSISATTLLVTILVVLVSLSWDWKLTATAIIAVLILQKWPSCVVDKVRTILFSVGFKFQMNLPENIFGIVGQILFTLLAFFGVSKIPSERWYDNILKRLDSIPKAMTGSTKIWDAAGKTFEFVSDEFRVFFLGEQREDLHFESEMAKQVKAWVDRVAHFSSAKQYVLIARDTATVREVEELFHQMYRWKHTPSLWKAMPIECQRVIISLGPTMNDLFKKSTRSTVHEGGPRRAPLGVFISGESGCGKSELLEPLSYALLNNREVPTTNFTNEIYVRNYETEYWDAYVGQKIVLFDDAFQMKDTPGNPSPEFMEAIRLLNTAPAHIHCADLNDKGRFFSSEICIYTSNLHQNFRSFITSVNCPEAAIRRLNVNAYRVKPRPQFAMEVEVDKKKVMRLDTQKVINCKQCAKMRLVNKDLHFCAHSQVFDRYDIFTDQPFEEGLSFSQVLQQLYAYDRKLCASEKQKLRSYDALIGNPRMYDNVDFDPDFKFEMKEEDLFLETQDFVSAGALDMRVPTDVVAMHELVVFLNYLTQQGIIDADVREQELAQHPALFATWHRRMTCGIVNGNMDERIAVDLVEVMQQAGIQYNHVENKYQFRTGLRQNWQNVCNAFSKWCSTIAQQVANIWNNSGIGELIGVVYLGLTMLSLAGLAYACFNGGKQCDNCGFHCEAAQASAPPPKTTRNFVTEAQIPIKPLHEWMAMYDKENGTAITAERGIFIHKIKNFIVKQQALNDALSEIPTKDFQTEASTSSGPPPPKTSVGFRVEAAESSAPPPKKTIGFTTEMYRDNACQAIETRLMNKSLYAIHNDSTVFGNVLFIQGTTFMMNAHFVEYFKTQPRTMKLYLSSCQGRLAEFNVGELVDSCVPLTKNGEQADAVLVPLDNRTSKISPHPSIVNLFVQAQDLNLFMGKYHVQLPSYARSSTDFFVPSARSLVEMQFKDLQETISSESYRMRIAKAWTYLGATSDGDCGGPLILNDNCAIRKIVGIHMGSRVLPNFTQGTGQLITQEMIIAGLAQVPMRCQCYTDIDMEVNEVDRGETLVGNVPLGAGLFVHGTTDKSTTTGGKTKLQPSKLHGIVEPLTMPAMLRPNGEHNPMVKGLMKFGKEVPMINPKVIELCAIDVANNLRLNVSRLDIDQYQRKLTYVEAVQGVGEDVFLAPINRSTSMGFPFSVDYHNPRGKRIAFGDDEWTMETPLAKHIEKEVLKLEENCRKGIQVGVYWSDTLKDERRPIAKVLQGKTRVFCGGPVHFTILFRQYFLGFAAWIMHNRNANEIATGTNVYSADWNEIVSKLASRGKTKDGMNIVAGDFANFDGSLSSQILWYILDLINDWYDDGEENAKIRHVLWMHIVHAVHINGNVIYQATHSQPSGCPITAILNSIYNSIIIRITYVLCAQEQLKKTGQNYVSMEKFNQFVACVSYGDDNLIAISDHILEWYNQVEITQAFSLIGHEYTDEAKTGIIVPVRNIEEVAFLKRKFVWDPIVNRYIAPLDITVVREICQWTKKGLAADSITEANIDVTLRELSLHDRNTFDGFKAVLQRECQKKGINYRFLSYGEYRGDVLEIPFKLELNKKKDVIVCRDESMEVFDIELVGNTIFVGEFDSIRSMANKLWMFCRHRHIQKFKTEEPQLQSLVRATLRCFKK